MTSPIVRDCSCCKRPLTAFEWVRLPQKGLVQRLPADETGPAVNYDYRDCYCGSTIVLEVSDKVAELADRAWYYGRLAAAVAA